MTTLGVSIGRIGSDRRRRFIATSLAFVLLASTLLVDTSGTASADDGTTVAFMGIWNTQASNINPDSWALGGTSPRLDFDLDGTAKLGVLGDRRSDMAAVFRNSTVHRVIRSDFTKNLAWLNEPEESRGPNPCDRTISDIAEITTASGDLIFMESTGDSGACFNGQKFVLRGQWSITGGTGVFEDATGRVESWGVGGQGRSREVIFGWINT